MKILIILCVALVAMAQEKYDTANDNFDIGEVLNNDRLLVGYSRCLLDKGPCTPEVKRVKDKVPEVLTTKCAKCTDRQKEMGKQLIKEIKVRHPDIWKALVKKYDPKGEYQVAFQEFLEE